MNQASMDGILNTDSEQDRILSGVVMRHATKAEREIFIAANDEILELLQGMSKPEKVSIHEVLDSIAKSTSSGKLSEAEAQDLLKFVCSVLIAQRLEGYLDKYPFWPTRMGHARKRLSLMNLLSPWTFLPVGRFEK